MKNRLQAELKSAMLAKDSVRLNTIRMIKKYVQELETSPGHQGDATDEEIQKVIQKMVKQSKDAQEQYNQAGRMDLVCEEKLQCEVLEEFLPKQMTEDEIKAYAEGVIAEIRRDGGEPNIGVLMKRLNPELAGRADGKTIAKVVKSLL